MKISSTYFVAIAAAVAAPSVAGAVDTDADLSSGSSGALRRRLGNDNGNNGLGNGNGGGEYNVGNGQNKKTDLFTAEYTDLAPYKIGIEYNVTTAYLNPTRSADAAAGTTTMTYTLTHAGATCMALRFSVWDLKNGQCNATISGVDDSVTMTDTANGRKNKNKGGGDLWSDHVAGETITLTTECRTPANVSNDATVEVDMYVACSEDVEQDPNAADSARLRRKAVVCDGDNRENAVCLQANASTAITLPNPVRAAAYEKSRAVARIIMGPNYECTAFLVSDKNHLITARHCVRTAAMAIDTEVQFMAEKFNCTADNCNMCGTRKKEFVHCPKGSATLIMNKYDLDFAVLEINETMCQDRDGADIKQTLESLFGHISVVNHEDADGPGDIDDQVYISQHPSGKAKEFAFFTDPSSSSDEACKIASTDETSCIKNSAPKLFGYKCDTNGGSSGSPVIAPGRNHTAVGLHTCGASDCDGNSDSMNKAVKFDEICAHLCKKNGWGGLCRNICNAVPDT